FLLGAALLAGCLAWMYQNKLIDQAKSAKGLGDVMKVINPESTKPLEIAAVPGALTRLFDGYAAGVAGLLLMLSAAGRSWKVALTVPPAARFAWLGGPLFGLPALVCTSIGTAVALAALYLDRR